MRAALQRLRASLVLAQTKADPRAATKAELRSVTPVIDDGFSDTGGPTNDYTLANAESKQATSSMEAKANTNCSDGGAAPTMQGSAETLFPTRDASSGSQPTRDGHQGAIQPLGAAGGGLVHLQAVARGWAARRTRKQLVLGAARLVLAAVTMQAAARGFLARLEVADLHSAALSIQDAWYAYRAYLDNLQFWAHELKIQRLHAVVEIQAWVRRFLVRSRCFRQYFHDYEGEWEEMWEEVECNGITMRTVRATLHEEHCQLSRVQAAFRGFQARKMLQPLTELRAALKGRPLSSVVRLRAVFGQRGACGLLTFDPGTGAGVPINSVRSALGKAKKASSKKKQRARKTARAADPRTKLVELGGIFHEVHDHEERKPPAREGRWIAGAYASASDDDGYY